MRAGVAADFREGGTRGYCLPEPGSTGLEPQGLGALISALLLTQRTDDVDLQSHLRTYVPEPQAVIEVVSQGNDVRHDCQSHHGNQVPADSGRSRGQTKLCRDQMSHSFFETYNWQK